MKEILMNTRENGALSGPERPDQAPQTPHTDHHDAPLSGRYDGLPDGAKQSAAPDENNTPDMPGLAAAGTPAADKPLPDANVAPEGHCLTAAYPESTRLDTGEPCDDGRDGK